MPEVNPFHTHNKLVGVWAVVVESQLLLLCLLDSAGDVEKEVGLADVAVRGAIYDGDIDGEQLARAGQLDDHVNHPAVSEDCARALDMGGAAALPGDVA